MRLTKTLISAALATSLIGTSAMAGGLAVEVVEPPVVVAEPAAPVQRSSWSYIVPLVAVAGLVALAASSDDNDDDTDTEEDA